MAEVRLNQIKNNRFFRLMLIAAPLTLGVTAVALADHQAAVTMNKPVIEISPSPNVSLTPVPKTDAVVLVNGKPVSVDANGNANVTLPHGGGSIDVSGGRTNVTTNSNSGQQSGSKSSNSVNVNLHNSGPSNGSGFSSSSVHVSGGSFKGSSHSTSFSSTNVFSTSSNNAVSNTH
jgi:hypothetical protein